MTDTGAVIGIIEDDADIAEILIGTLSDYGYRTHHFCTAAAFQSALEQFSPDICLVDLGLPDQNGLDLIKSLSTRTDIATIIISGRRGVTDRIVGLEMGADDYIAKPFEPAEIVARVRSVLRRTRRPNHIEPSKPHSVASFAGWKVDTHSYTLTGADGNSAPLSQAEMAVLCVFLNAPHRLLSRAQILDALETDPDTNFDRSVDVRISRLRTKLGEDPQNPKLIKTVYGAGYLFVAEVEWT